MAVFLSPVGGAAAQFFTNTGAVLTGGKLYTYLAGTTTPATTYTTSVGNIAWTNPIILDAAGRVSGSGEIWLTVGVAYKFVLKDSTDVLIGTYDNILGGVDSSNVTYQPAGTGAVTTTVQAKLRQFPSVKDFGAVGDGTTDDTAAIVAALAAANSIYFPSGTYLVSGNINIQNKTLIGFSWRNTVIQLSGSNTNTPVFINSANSSSPWGTGAGFTLDNLDVRGNWDGSTANPIGINFFNDLGSIVKWYAGAYVNITNCRISGSFAHALAFERLGYSYIQYNEITTNKYDGVHLSGLSGTESITSTWVSNNSIHSCRGTSCIYVKNGLTVIATQNVLEDAQHGFYVDGNDNRGVSFCFNDMEQMGSAGVNIQGAGVWFEVSNNFLGVTTPIIIANSREFRSGSYTNNAFSTLDYVTVAPTIGSGTTSDTPMNFFGRAVDGSGTGKIGWRSNNNFAADPEVEIIGVHYGTVNQRGGQLLIRTANPATGVLSDRFKIDELGNTYPTNDNTQTLGAASYRWSVVYAGTGAINTSDANSKQDVRDLLDAEKAAAIEMKGLLKAYRFKDAVTAKGDNARIHFGAIAQDVAAVFSKHGLNADQYGLFCSDTWYEYNGIPVKVDADKKYITIHYELDGVIVHPEQDGKMPEGSIEITNKFDTVERTQLGLRYDELFAFIITSL